MSPMQDGRDDNEQGKIELLSLWTVGKAEFRKDSRQACSFQYLSTQLNSTQLNQNNYKYRDGNAV